MKHPEYNFVDTAIGGPQGRNNVIELGQWGARMPADKHEVYCTWHRFPQAYLDHFQGNEQSVSGYNGQSYADFLPFDFDGEDLDAVLETVRLVLRDMELRFDVSNGVRAFFSGSKGFHILLDAELFGGWMPSVELSNNLKDLAEGLMRDYQGFDAAVYDKNRLLRCGNTQNNKSGLWKVPLTLDEIQTLSIEQIKELAVAERKIECPAWGDCEQSSALVELWNQTKAGPVKATRRADPTGLWQRGLKEGDGRDNAAFALARMLRKKGLDESDALEILRLWDTQQADPLGDRVLEIKVGSTYRMSQSPVEQDSIMTPTQLAEAYHRHIENLKGRKILLGLPRVDRRIRGVVPGEICTIIARSGVGKTIIAQNIILNSSEANHESSSLFVSLEQPDSMCFERYAQMATGRPGRSIEEDWQELPNERENIRDAVVEKLGDRSLTYVNAATLDSLNTIVDQTEVILGSQLHLLVIDYLGYIGTDGHGRNLYEQLSNVARGLKQFAKSRELALVLLCQVGRTAGEDGKVPLTKSSARDTGAIEESADIMLGLYRPNMNENDDTQIAVQILKNRKGMEGETYGYDLDRISLRITGEGEYLDSSEIPAESFIHPNN